MTNLDFLIDNYSGVFLTDGLPLKAARERYRQRRDFLLSILSEPALIFGVQESMNQGNSWLMAYHPLYQEPYFLYLTGIVQENTALYLNPKTKEVILFIPKKNKAKEFWDGKMFGLGDKESELEAAIMTGITHLKPIKKLRRFIAENCKKQLIVFDDKFGKVKPILKNNSYKFIAQLQTYLRRNKSSVLISNQKQLEYDQRLQLDQVDIDNLHFANKKTGEVFISVLSSIKSFKSETQVAGFMKGEIYSQSALGESFPLIVANQKNATVLHYHKNNSVFSKNSMLLLDFGVRYFQMPADISRTIPINGKFNPLQRLLYEIVLETQMKVELLCKAGVSIAELNDSCWTCLEKLLFERFISKGGIAKREYDKQPHNVSHLIAHCVHDGDPQRNYRTEALKENMVISNEPGLYGFFEMNIDGVLYSDYIGIRIEDNLLITKNGCKNLSESVPKSVTDLEQLMC